jgi:hypothetical protein
MEVVLLRLMNFLQRLYQQKAGAEDLIAILVQIISATDNCAAEA